MFWSDTMFKIIKAITGAIFAFVLMFLTVIVYLNALRVMDFRTQRTHIRSLDAFYEDYETLDESVYTSFIMNSDLRLNEVRFIASHNSYKKNVPGIGFIAIGLGENFDEARSLRYETNTLTEQLIAGIRSFEFDIRYRQGNYEMVHVPLVDHRSHAIDFQLALEEVRRYSENHPNHLPITLLIEIKDDWMILDPFLDDYDEAAFDVLDNIIEVTLNEHLFRPSDMLNDDTLRYTIINDGWPTVEALLGKIIVIKHPSQYTTMYVERDESLMTLSMFPGVYANHVDKEYASFVVNNSPDVEIIRELVDQGFIVRTRSDANLEIDLERMQNALESGAQIITTDYFPNHNFINENHVVTFEDGYTIDLNPILEP